MDSTTTLAILITAQNEADAELQKLQGDMEGMASSFKQAGMSMAATGAIIDGALALNIKSFMDATEQVNILSERTGFSTKSLSELSYMAKMTGTDLSSVQTAFRGMANALQTAEEGVAKGADWSSTAFGKLNLSITDLQAMKPEDQFYTIMEALGGLQDFTERAAIAQKMFGRSALDLMPLIDQGAAGMEAMKKQAADLGVVLGTDMVNNGAALNSSFKNMQESTKGLSLTIGNSLAPVLAPIVKFLTDTVSKIREWMEANPELTKVILLIAGALGTILVVMGTFLGTVGLIITSLDALSTALAFLAANPIVLIIAAIVALIAIGVLLATHWDWVCEQARKIWGAICDWFKEVWDKIKGFFDAAWKWLQEWGLLFFGVPGLIIKYWQPILDFFKKLWSDITDAFWNAISWIVDKINWVISMIDKIPGMHLGDINLNVPNAGSAGSNGSNTQVNVIVNNNIDSNALTSSVSKNVVQQAALQGDF